MYTANKLVFRALRAALVVVLVLVRVSFIIWRLYINRNIYIYININLFPFLLSHPFFYLMQEGIIIAGGSMRAAAAAASAA